MNRPCNNSEGTVVTAVTAEGGKQRSIVDTMSVWIICQRGCVYQYVTCKENCYMSDDKPVE